MLKSNELIAKFMGEPTSFIHDTGSKVVELKMTHNYLDWNKLMPVVEKINKTKPKHDFFSHLSMKNLTINRLYKAVVKFIKWYNKQTF